MIRTIAMLTHNDQTVDNAKDVYIANRGAITNNWGFKDINITKEEARELAAIMQADGKETFFESLETDAEKALESAKLAVECNFDYIIGMEYFDIVHEYIKDKDIKYFPTCGKRAGYPIRMLHGTIDEIIADANRILEKGVAGISLSVFRYADGDPLELAKEFVKRIDAPLAITGSVNSDARLDFLKEVEPWGFAIGSTLFEKDQITGETVADKLDYVFNYVKK